MIMNRLKCNNKKRMLLWKATHHEVCFEAISKRIASIQINSSSMFFKENVTLLEHYNKHHNCSENGDGLGL
jgi:hypothetical protein